MGAKIGITGYSAISNIFGPLSGFIMNSPYVSMAMPLPKPVKQHTVIRCKSCQRRDVTLKRIEKNEYKCLGCLRKEANHD